MAMQQGVILLETNCHIPIIENVTQTSFVGR